MNSIYESGLFDDLPDMSMHPGGLRLSDRAARLAGLKDSMLAADIGCGTGATAAFLTAAYHLRVIGLEKSEALVDAGRKKHPGLELRPWDGGALPFEDGSLDAALLECVLSVLGDAGSTLAECARVLKSAGALIVSDVISKCESLPPDGLLTVSALTEQLARAGFTIEIIEDHTPALKTYVSSLYELGGAGFDACALLGDSCLKSRPRLSALRYTLIIARKN